MMNQGNSLSELTEPLSKKLTVSSYYKLQVGMTGPNALGPQIFVRTTFARKFLSYFSDWKLAEKFEEASLL